VAAAIRLRRAVEHFHQSDGLIPPRIQPVKATEAIGLDGPEAGLAHNSWWGLLVSAISLPLLIARMLDEESALSTELPGYDDYRRAVRYRLIPGCSLRTICCRHS